MADKIFVAASLPDFDNRSYKVDYITSVKRRLEKLSSGVRRKKRRKNQTSWFVGPQFFRTKIMKNTCHTIDTFEVEHGSYNYDKNGKISAILYDILSGKYEFSVYDNQSDPAPQLTAMEYDSSYYSDLELLNFLPEHEDNSNDVNHLYYLVKSRALKKSKDNWLDNTSKPTFFKAMFKRKNDYLNATFLVKVKSFREFTKGDIPGFSIRVYSLGHKEHELCFFEDGSTQINRNVHL